MNLKELIDSKLGEFEKEFWDSQHSCWRFGTDFDDAKSFLSQTIKESIEAYQKAVEVEEVDGWTNFGKSPLGDLEIGHNAALQKVEEKKKEFMQ